MNGKSIFDLTIEDLNKNPIWYFPMEESANDETYIFPVESIEILEFDYEIIVKTFFWDKENNEYIGYIYWGNPETVDFIKPVIIIGDENISFWKGIRKPNKIIIDNLKKQLGENIFPLKYESQEVLGLKKITGNLDGLYYIDDLNNIAVEKI